MEKNEYERMIWDVKRDLPAKVERTLFPKGRHWAGLTYQASPYTRKEFLTALEFNPELRLVVDQIHQNLSAASLSFAAEVFARVFFPNTPRVLSPNPVFRWASAFHDQMQTVPAFRRYQRMYAGDAEGAGIAAQHLLRAFVDTLPDDTVRQDFDPNETPDEDNVLLDADRGLELIQAAEAGDEEAQQMLEQAKAALEAFKQQQQQQQLEAAAANRDLLINIGKCQGGLKQAVADACDKSNKAVSSNRELFAGMGLIDTTNRGSNPVSVSQGIKAAMAQKLRSNRRLKNIALLAGRFRRIAADKQRGVRGYGWDEVASVERGQDIPRVVPAQLLGLVEPDLSMKFDMDFAERKLMQYRLESKPPKGRGPIVFCIDVSGSMEGDRDIWAKALFAGVAELAIRQKRWCTAIQFDHRITREDLFDPRSPNPLHFMECVAHFSGGSTDFERPLNRALDIIGEQPEFAKADIVFLTDGEAGVYDDTVARLRAMQAKNPVHVHGILVGGDTRGHTLRNFCDDVTVLPDVLNAAVNTADKLYTKMV